MILLQILIRIIYLKPFLWHFFREPTTQLEFELLFTDKVPVDQIFMLDKSVYYKTPLEYEEKVFRITDIVYGFGKSLVNSHSELNIIDLTHSHCIFKYFGHIW